MGISTNQPGPAPGPGCQTGPGPHWSPIGPPLVPQGPQAPFHAWLRSSETDWAPPEPWAPEDPEDPGP